MERYDWDRGFGRGRGSGRYQEDFDRGFGGSGGRWPQEGRFRFAGERQRPGEYDRGNYGRDHPGYSSYPGGYSQGRDQGRERGAFGDLGRSRFSGGPSRFDRDRDQQGREHGGWGEPRRHGGAGEFGGGARSGGGGYSGGGYGGGGYGGGGYSGGGHGGGGYSGGGGSFSAGRQGGSYGGGTGSSGGRRFGGGGFGGGFSGGGRGGYDTGYAREPFMPDLAYQQHPEYDRPPRHMSDRWPEGAAGSQGGFELEDDDEIRQAVRQNLFQDNWVDADRIDVQVEEGIVTLSGDVDDFLEARYAWDDAWETSGVRGVVNHIHVRVDEPAGEHDSMVQSATGTADSGKDSGKGQKSGD